MSQSITIELHFFGVSILWGAIVLLAYDQLRVLRRIIRHNNFWVAVEDLIFWIIASVFIFAMIYVQNSGTIRGFSVAGMVIGMVIYHYVMSDIIVKLISRGILLLLYPFTCILKYIGKVLKFVINKGKKLFYRIFVQLKNIVKSVKIKLIKNKKKQPDKKKTKKIKKNKTKEKAYNKKRKSDEKREG